MTSTNEFSAACLPALNEDLTKICRANRQNTAEFFVNWLANSARKAPLENVLQRVDDWSARIRRMAENAVVKMEKGKLAVVVTGESEATLNGLDRGTDWFEPYTDVRDKLVALLLGDQST